MFPIIETTSTCCSIGTSLNSFLLSSNQATVARLNAPIAVKLADVTLFCFAKSVRPDMTSSPLARTMAYLFTPRFSAATGLSCPAPFHWPLELKAKGIPHVGRDSLAALSFRLHLQAVPTLRQATLLFHWENCS